MNDRLLTITLIALFVAVFVGVETTFAWWQAKRSPQARKLARRLASLSAGGVDTAEASLHKRRAMLGRAWLERALMMVPRIASIDRFVLQSGVPWTLADLALYSLGLCMIGALGVLLAGGDGLAASMSALLLGAAPVAYLSTRRTARLNKFDRQLPDALDLIGRALRAGHALPSALQMAGNELPSPAGDEFRHTFDEINFGVSAQEALQALARRVPSTDLSFFVIAVLIQRETGGNLSAVLDNISAIIRQRLLLYGKVQALSAEGRFSGVVLTLLPFLTAGLLFMVDRDFMSLLWTDEAGIKMLKGGLVMLCVGALWMRRVVKIRV